MTMMKMMVVITVIQMALCHRVQDSSCVLRTASDVVKSQNS